MFFLVSPWAFGPRKSSEYPWGIEFPLFKLGYLPPVFCWLVFEKRAVVVFFNSMLNWRSELYFGLYYFRTTLATSVFWHRKWENYWKYIKAPMGFEPMTSCLLDRRSNHLSYGASPGDEGTGVVEGLIFDMEPAKQLRSFLCVWQKNRGMRGWYSKAMI